MVGMFVGFKSDVDGIGMIFEKKFRQSIGKMV